MHLTSRLAALSLTLTLALGVALGPAPGATASGPAACVRGGGCYGSLAEAVRRAPSGSTIDLSAGVFRGGVTISKSLTLLGRGAQRTVVRGGGPVVTVDGPPSLHVSMRRLTLTGGLTRSFAIDGEDEDFQAYGGGLLVPPVFHSGQPATTGATVVLDHVRVSDNVADPTSVYPSPSGVKCPDGDCPFARSAGGGIASFGTLSLAHARVTGNRSGSHVSDAIGGGVFNAVGDLRIRSSLIGSNRAVAERIGRFAEGGGVFVDSGDADVSDTRVAGNRAILRTRWPVRAQGELIDMNANSGAIHVGDGSHVRVSHSRLTHNSIEAVDPVGEPLAFDAAMLVGDSRLDMDHTMIDDNHVHADVATAEDVGPSGTALEVDGPATITRSAVVDNTVSTYSGHGRSIGSGGLAVYDFVDNPRQVTLRHVEVLRNVVNATSRTGSALVVGAGVDNNSLLDLDHVVVARNQGVARAPDATAQGGGVWNSADLAGTPVRLRAHDSSVVRNSLVASQGGTRQGGGLYTTEPVTLLRTSIRHNDPDDCSGCDGRRRTAVSVPRLRSARPR